MNKFKAVMILALGVVPVAFAVIVLLANMGDTTTLHVISKDFTTSRSMMAIIVAVIGWAVVRLGRAFIPKGIRAVRDAWAKDRPQAPLNAEKSDSDQQ